MGVIKQAKETLKNIEVTFFLALAQFDEDLVSYVAQYFYLLLICIEYFCIIPLRSKTLNMIAIEKMSAEREM